MLVNAQRVSVMKDNQTFCRPSQGYINEDSIDVNLDDYTEVAIIRGELPDSDEKWAKGAPSHIRVEDRIYKRKAP